jgi:peptidoglycan/xylan/chitin deacetylase (PgdA/CDA1 family)
MYHQISPQPRSGFTKYTVSPRTFARQMRLLTTAGYQPISIDRWLAARHEGAHLPESPVVISFDDGFREAVEHAVPVLKQFKFRAIFFLVAGLVGATSTWLERERGLQLSLVDWDDAARLQRDGFDIGSHTLTHPHLVEISARSCREELRRSRELIEDHLGQTVRHLAYPFGSHDKRVRELAAESGYVSGCTTNIGLSSASEDAYALSRVPVVGGESLLDFAARLWCGSSVRECRNREIRRVRTLVGSLLAELHA